MRRAHPYESSDSTMGAVVRARLHAARGPFVLTAGVLLAWMFALPPLRTLGSPPVAATLRLPGPYLLLAPICDLLDAMSLLSVRQHAAFVGTLALF